MTATMRPTSDVISLFGILLFIQAAMIAHPVLAQTDPKGAETEQTSKQGSTTSQTFPNLFGGPFNLIDHHGQRRADTDFAEKWRLMFFGYTNCPDICPTNLAIMSDALNALPPHLAASIQPIFITLDPVRDTPDYLADYVAAFHPRLIGLTGDAQSISQVIRAFRIHRRKVPDTSLPEGEYWIDHSSLTFLMGPDGQFKTLFPHDTDADVMGKRLEKHLTASN